MYDSGSDSGGSHRGDSKAEVAATTTAKHSVQDYIRYINVLQYTKKLRILNILNFFG